MVLYTEIRKDNFTQEDLDLVRFVSKKRQDFIINNKSDKNKLLSLYAELLLRYGLNKFYNINKDISIKIDSNGKPYIEDILDIDFNLSHTTNMIMCGISNKSKIGVDVEHKRKVREDVAKKVYHPSEIEYINANKDRFFEIWTKKEAYTKYVGTGLRFNLTDINMLSKDHTDKLISFQKDDFFFSVYSDDKSDSLFEISFEELFSYFQNL